MLHGQIPYWLSSPLNAPQSAGKRGDSCPARPMDSPTHCSLNAYQALLCIHQMCISYSPRQSGILSLSPLCRLPLSYRKRTFSIYIHFPNLLHFLIIAVPRHQKFSLLPDSQSAGMLGMPALPGCAYWHISSLFHKELGFHWMLPFHILLF